MKTQTENQIEDQNGNKSKPLLQAVFLAPYLPYEIEVLTPLDEKNKIIGLKNETYFIENGNTYAYGEIRYCRPILKPILDLSLLVFEEFEKYDGKRNGKANEEIINLFCEENGVNEIIENIELKSLPYECVEFMFRNHYDFFGLIEKGLAVSIHDVV
jgi:hypothetical protein